MNYPIGEWKRLERETLEDIAYYRAERENPRRNLSIAAIDSKIAHCLSHLSEIREEIARAILSKL